MACAVLKIRWVCSPPSSSSKEAGSSRAMNFAALILPMDIVGLSLLPRSSRLGPAPEHRMAHLARSTPPVCRFCCSTQCSPRPTVLSVARAAEGLGV